MNSSIWYLWKRGNKRKSKFYLQVRGPGRFTKKIGHALGLDTKKKAEEIKAVYDKLGQHLEIEEIKLSFSQK